MNDVVSVFSFGAGRIRTLLYEGQPYFVAVEVARALGYTNPHKAIIDHCKHMKILKGGACFDLTVSPRGIGIMPESDVYRLALRSRLSSAIKFQDWITEEVLPALRKQVFYNTNHRTIRRVYERDYERI